MLDNKFKPQDIVSEHHETCSDIYTHIDMSLAPDRYRKMPGERSRLAASLSDSDKEMIADLQKQEMFRQWAMSGDPVADAFAAKFRELGHRKALQMLDKALSEGLDKVEDVPPELIKLIRHVEQTPDWVDWNVINDTANILAPFVNALSQTGWRAAFVLTFGNSYQGLPMVLTGALHKPETTPGRIKETMSAAWYVTVPDGLRRYGEVFKIIVKVRVMHSLVRVNLLQSPDRWDVSTYGVPIPMSDMYGTFAIVAPLLRRLEKLKGKPIDIGGLRYVMWLIGVDERMGYTNITEMCQTKTMLEATLNHRYEPWASELTAASMNAYLRPNHSFFNEFMNKADRQLSELAIQLMMGKRNASALGVSPGVESYFGAVVMLVPFVVRYAGFKLIEFLPGGKKWVRKHCTNNAYQMFGIVNPETNPDEYRSLNQRAI